MEDQDPWQLQRALKTRSMIGKNAKQTSNTFNTASESIDQRV